ncbi:MAG: ATP-binding protein [Nanoarchaeota archaeon]|nr:ATP-binding protein [Nanoarchaeota archaeon]
MRFYNREREIKALSSIKNNFRIAVIGRRRVGKTTLVEHYYGRKCLTFFITAEKAEKETIGDWVRDYPALHFPSVSTFREFFEFVFFHLHDKVIFIDEIQNSLKVSKPFPSDLQHLIDKHKPNLVISGSLISVMKKVVEDYKSPLYGRFDFVIKLAELDFRTILLICNDLRLGTETAFMLYAVFGGVPKYFELIEKLSDFEFKDAVLNFFVRYPRPLHEEVKTMLKEEFGKEHKTFFAILSAIMQGKSRNSEIAGFLGKKGTEITKYLAMLKDDFELIEHRVPLAGGKKGLYAVKSNIVSFWFANIWKYNELLETRQEEKLEHFLEENMNKHIAGVFEKTIYELLSSGAIKIMPFAAIGRQWGHFAGEKGKDSYEIDIMLTDEKSKSCAFCECKWREKVNALDVISSLSEKVRHVEWHSADRKETFAVFAKSFKKRINEFEGKKVICFDLKDIAKALK